MALLEMLGLWPTMNRKLILHYFYILLFLGCFILFLRFDYPMPVITITTKSTPALIKTITKNFPNTTTKVILKSTKLNAKTTNKPKEFPLICPSKNTNQKCPRDNYPSKMVNDNDNDNDNGNDNGNDNDQLDTSSTMAESCPDYFRWIHEDLKPWKTKGITKDIVEAGKNVAYFRLVILDGRVYVEKYKKAYQTRDEFTIWGILQLLRLYPGKLPDLDMLFECNDYPVIKKSDYYDNKAGVTANYTPPVPMFHYCGDDQHFDIPFPDWSFWGWHEINIKPWELQLEDIKTGNKKVKWIDRVAKAYWKGNMQMGNRVYLSRCNSTKWNTEIYQQHWALEVRQGFNQSNLADQCNHRYKIYMEGKTWSVSEKFIQACDSMLLLVQPRYYEFFSRSLLPLKHYWPINPSKLCHSIKFAVNWGNEHPEEAEEIGKAGSRFIMEELKMKYIYDYMFHLLHEYGKLMKYTPTIPPRAVEVCSETMACNVLFHKERKWKFNSLVKAPSQISPCSIPPPYDPHHLRTFLNTKEELLRDVVGLSNVS